MKNRAPNDIPASVVRRFPKYYAYVQRRRRDGGEWVSSQDLGEALGLTSSTVRQDLSHVDFSGISKRGYSTVGLEHVLARVLGADQELRVVIVGAGNLGRALALHGEFAGKGYRIVGIFDSSPRLAGRTVGTLTIQPMKDLAAAVKRRKADIGIIAVPSESAQSVADQLVLSRIRGLLNLAHVHLLVPRRVSVVDTRIVASLQELSYAIRSNRFGRPT